MAPKNYLTSYRTAVKWCGNSLILCNDIPSIDDEIWDNMEFDLEDESGYPVDIYQYFLTDCSQSEVEFLKEHFEGLCFTYSPKLDLYILCVTHFGTCWDGVKISTDLEQAAEKE